MILYNILLFKKISFYILIFSVLVTLGDSMTHWAGTGLKKNFELKRRNLFCFEEHTSVIIKNFKTENSNGGFLRKSKKSPRKWPFFENLTKIYF